MCNATRCEEAQDQVFPETTLAPRPCSNCGNGPDLCRCWYCEECGTLTDSTCDCQEVRDQANRRVMFEEDALLEMALEEHYAAHLAEEGYADSARRRLMYLERRLEAACRVSEENYTY